MFEAGRAKAAPTKDPAVQTVMVIYVHAQAINYMSVTTGTYTMTYANTPGVYTIWPVFRKPEIIGGGRDVLMLPITLLPGESGGISTHSNFLEPAIRSTTLPSSTTHFAPRTTFATQMLPSTGTDQIAATSTAISDVLTPDISSQWTLRELPEQAVAAFGLRATLFGALIAGFLAFYWAQSGWRRVQRRRERQLDEKLKDGRCNWPTYNDRQRNYGPTSPPSSTQSAHYSGAEQGLSDVEELRNVKQAENDDAKTWKNLFPVAEMDYRRTLVLASVEDESTAWVANELSDILKPNGPLDVAVYVADDAEAPLRPPENKGHEANVYLSYIVDFYDSLPDVFIFMHAHRIAWHNSDLLDHDAALAVRNLSPAHVISNGYVNLRCHWDPGCPDWIHPSKREVDDYKQEESIIGSIWAELFPAEPVPDTLA
ncbi:hypothetical protein B0A55_08653 [Friedmanniomyces simplex]|uniref:Uncharacterized protein n=1 Tax=Friedmanniomyces simplex TaxID=329884 RepID=A0A4U0X458_9PEZI|nr:hypothetical protein B0A55_08653 [Friedmanniomyces simplex]